ncbi:MAG: hypothetical protein AAGD22_13960 [Verrucomicrobiota bacterium]
MKTREDIEKGEAPLVAGRSFGRVLMVALVFVVSPMYADEGEEEEEWEEEHEEREFSMGEVVEFLKTKWPEGHQFLETIKREESVEDYAEAVRMATDVVIDYHAHLDVSEAGAETFLGVMKLELEMDRLWEKVWEGEGDEAKTVQEIRRVRGKIFDLRLGMEEAELAFLKGEVNQWEALLAERRENRERIVTEEVDEILAEIRAERAADEEEDEASADEEEEED